MYNPFAFFEKLKMGEDATSYEVYSPPKTMTYLLLGPEGAYTDWHVDFAGSSVWYHVVKGRKIFMVAPDTAHNIGQFLKWSSSDDQGGFLGERLEKCARLVLNEGDTLFLPGGWFHAVSTPVDSVVVGGNFINPLRVKQLLTVRMIERRLGISSQAEFPKFNMLMYYAAGDFIKRCQQSRMVDNEETKSVFVSELEAKGLECLGVYLQSVVEELDSNITAGNGRMTKGKRTLREKVDRCKKEIGLLTSFLRTELERLKAVYNWDETEENDLTVLDEIISGDTSLSRAWRRSRRASDNELPRREEYGGAEGDAEEPGEKGGMVDGAIYEDKEDEYEDESEDDLAMQCSSERAEESVEVILGRDDEGAPSSSLDQSVDRQSSFEVLLSSSDEEESYGMRTMMGIKSRAPLIGDSDDEVDLSVVGKPQTTDCSIMTKVSDSGGPLNQIGPSIDENEMIHPDGDNNRADGNEYGKKAGTAEEAAGKLLDMIEEGILSPGPKVLLWKYKGCKELADLREDGLIEITLDGERMAFKNPSALAMFTGKRKGSSRKSCNGWLEIWYKGYRLSDWRGVVPNGNPPQSAPSGATGGVLRPPCSDTGFLKRYKEKGDDPRQSRVEKLRAEALKKHSNFIAKPLSSLKAVTKGSEVTLKDGGPKVSAKAAETLAGVEELTKIFKDLEKEQDLLNQFNSGTLNLKDGGKLLREKVQKNVDAFNAKAATISNLLSESNVAPALSEELVKIQPNIIETIQTLIKRANSKPPGLEEPGTSVSKGARSRPLDDHDPLPKASDVHQKSSRDASPRLVERKRHISDRDPRCRDLDRDRRRDTDHDRRRNTDHDRRRDKDHDRRRGVPNDRIHHRRYRDRDRHREVEVPRRDDRGCDRRSDRVLVPMKRADRADDRGGHSQPIPMVVDPRLAPMRKNE